MARRVGATWFVTAVTFDNVLSDNLYGYYSVDGGPDVQILPKIAVELYASEVSREGETVNLYRGSFNPVIPEGAVGDNVVLKIYDPNKMIDYLEYDPIDVCTDEATTAVISPSSASVPVGRTRQFTANFYAADDLPTTNHVDPLWSVAGGGIMNPSTGLFTAGSEVGGPHLVGMTAGAVVAPPASVGVIAASGVRVPIIANRGLRVGL